MSTSTTDNLSTEKLLSFIAQQQEQIVQLQQRIKTLESEITRLKKLNEIKLTGTCASDMSDSAGTLWLDIEKRDWPDSLLQNCGLSREHMPELYEGCQITGYLRKNLAAQWRMPAVPVVAGGGDNKDLFYAHIGGIDTLALSLEKAAKLIGQKVLLEAVSERYQGWSQPLGKAILAGEHSLDSLRHYILKADLQPQPVSGKQECLENLVNRYLYS